MAVVVKNTFLDVAEHKFLRFDEPCGASRRCHSVPRDFTPTARNNAPVSIAMPIDIPSPRSDVSYYSAAESSEAPFSCVFSGGDSGEVEADALGPSMQFSCATPTSSLGSPREYTRCLLEEGCGSQTTMDICSYLGREDTSSEDLEPETEPEIHREVEYAPALDARTKLKVGAPAFQPAPKDTRLDAIISCLQLVLTSCGQIRDIKIERGLVGASPVLISAELQRGPCASSRSYEVVHLAKQSLDAIAERLPSVTLLSARVQKDKDECGYSLRSSMACLPEQSQGCMCWDMFRKGNCPRRGTCRWYHPQDSDLARIKVSIRYSEDVSYDEEKPRVSSSTGRHQISLGALVQ